MPTSSLDLSLPHPPTALVGYLGAGKSRALRAHYESLLRRGHRAERLLVWVSNFSQASIWKAAIGSFDFHYGETQVLTFRSWVRRELLLNWPLVERGGLLEGAPHTASPFLVGITAAQQILRDVVEPMLAEYEALDRCYTVPSQRLIQALDSYARLVEHGLPPHEAAARLDRGHRLSNDSEVLHRFVGEAIARYRAFCFKHRVLDYNLQLELFTHSLWRNERYRARLAESLDALLVDQVEETFPVAQDVIAHLMEAGPGVVLTRDLNGGLREYLGADPRGADRLIERCSRIEMLDSVLVAPEMARFGEALARVVLDGPDGAPPAPVPGAAVVFNEPRTLRVQMFDTLARRIQHLIQHEPFVMPDGTTRQGVPEEQIVVIAPVTDPLLAWHLRQALSAIGKPLRVLSGSNRVIDHRPVRILVTLARLARPGWNAPPSEQDVAEALESLLELHPLEGPHLQKLVYLEHELMPPDLCEWPKHLAGRREAYGAVHAWVARARKGEVPLDRLFEDAFATLFAPRRLRAMSPDPALSGRPAGEPYQWTAEDALDILQIDQLIQGARHYRQLAAAIGIPLEEMPKRFLRSIYAGELAERPLIPLGVLPAAVTLYTAAKYAEEGPPAQYQLWVDASAPSWAKSDVRELMNPRVLSRHWAGGAYTDEHDTRHMAEKLARTLHSIVLKATGSLEVFSSDYGSDGSELGGELAYWLSELVSDREVAHAE